MINRSLKKAKVKRGDNVVWGLRKVGAYPNGHVSCDLNGDLVLWVEPGDGHSYGIKLPRKLARLMAKRIEQCLSET